MAVIRCVNNSSDFTEICVKWAHCVVCKLRMGGVTKQAEKIPSKELHPLTDTDLHHCTETNKCVRKDAGEEWEEQGQGLEEHADSCASSSLGSLHTHSHTYTLTDTLPQPQPDTSTHPYAVFIHTLTYVHTHIRACSRDVPHTHTHQNFLKTYFKDLTIFQTSQSPRVSVQLEFGSTANLWLTEAARWSKLQRRALALRFWVLNFHGSQFLCLYNSSNNCTRLTGFFNILR